MNYCPNCGANLNQHQSGCGSPNSDRPDYPQYLRDRERDEELSRSPNADRPDFWGSLRRRETDREG